MTDRLDKIHTLVTEMFEKQKELFTKVNNLEKILYTNTQPHSYFTKRDENLDCYCSENGTFPHLFHTNNPQLNNISCLLIFIIRNHYNQNKREKSILENLEKANDKINQLLSTETNENTILHLETLNKDLKDILKNHDKQITKPTERLRIGPPPSHGRS